MRFLLVDLKRCFTERGFLASVLCGIFIIAVSMLISLGQGTTDVSKLFISSHSLILPFIAPILTALPYSNMNMIEKESKYEVLMLFRQNIKGWEFKRFLTNGIVSGACLVIPLIILFVACLFMGLDSLINEILSVILLDFIFGFAFGSLSYSLTFVNQKKYIPTIAPQVIYLLLIYAFPYLELELYYPPLCFSPWILPSMAQPTNINIVLTVIICISLMLVLFGKYKEKIATRIRFGGKYEKFKI